MREISINDTTGRLSTSIGELEMEPFGNHVSKFHVGTIVNSMNNKKMILDMHANHRSEDIEMNMSALLDPDDAVYLGKLLQSWGESIRENE